MGMYVMAITLINIATKKGIAVTVVEMADRVMNRTVDPQISDYFQKLHENNGVSFKFNASLEEIRGDDKPDLVLCSDGTEIKADIDHVVDISRGTTIEENDVRIHTVEHALAAVSGLRLDLSLIHI